MSSRTPVGSKSAGFLVATGRPWHIADPFDRTDALLLVLVDCRLLKVGLAVVFSLQHSMYPHDQLHKDELLVNH
jgi:hypothetical protein